jgi:hypothetical protein
MQEITVGGREVFYTGTLLIRDGETAALNVPIQSLAAVGTDQLRIVLQIGNVNEQVPKVAWETVDGVVRVTLSGWRYGAGAALDLPVKLGSVYFGGREHWLWFDMAHYRIGQMNVTHVMLSRGQPSGK